MFLFLGFGQVELIFDGLEFLEDFGELLMFLVFEVVFEWVQLVKKDVGTFFVIGLGSEVRTWDKGQVFGTGTGAVDLSVHLEVVRWESSITWDVFWINNFDFLYFIVPNF